MTRIIILIIFLFWATIVKGQHAIHYTTDNGLPTNHIYQVEQDANGFIWFGSNMGVIKFDGNSFKIFTTSDGLPNNDVWRIEATKDGKVWYFAKSRRLGYIYRDSVYSFPIEGNIPQQPKNLVIDSNSIHFFGVVNDNYGYLSLIDSKWRLLNPVQSNIIVNIFARKNFLLPNTTRLKLIGSKKTLFDKNNKVLFHFKTDKQTSDYIDQIPTTLSKQVFFPEKNLYFVINPFAITVFNFNDSTALGIDLFHRNYTNDQLAIIFPELQEHGDNFQISQYNKWISIDGKLNILEQKEFTDKLTSVHLFKDSYGNFWNVGHDYGIMSYPKNALSNKYFYENKKIQTINYENGHLFINIFNEGWYIFNPKTQEAELIVPCFGKVYEMGYHDYFKLYYFYSNGTVWYTKDLKKIRKVTEIKVNEKIRGKVWLAGGKSIIETPTGFSGASLGYYMDYDTTFKVINNEILKNDQWNTKGCKALLKFKGTIYVGGEGVQPLTYLDGKTSAPTHINPLLQAPVNNMIVYNSECMLVGTDGFGAFFYDGEKKVVPLPGSEGFSINKILLYNGDIWMATGKGIHQFKIGKSGYYLAESIYDEDGLKGNNVNTIQILDGNLYVGQDNGLVIIPLKKNKYKKTITPYYSGGKYYDHQSNAYTTSYGNNISLSFGVLSLPSQKYVRYFYKTDNNEQWIPTDVTTLTMGKQMPGNYTISFKAVDQHHNVGKTSIKLIVVPLWYQTTFVKIFFIVVLLIIAILATTFYRKRIDNKKKAELLLNKTLAELELKALRSQMNPHFVFNSLNAIQYYIVKNKTELSEEYLAKFSRLVRLFFEYSKYDSLKVSQEADMLSRYLEIEKLRFEEKLNYTVYIDPEIDIEEVEVPSMILQPIVENAVNHGIFHKKENGHVWIKFERASPSSILISVEDNGVGTIAMKEIQKEADGNYRSKSSEVIKERLKILSENRISNWKINYKIIDISTTNPKETGTLVEILIEYK